ncbi:histidine kinase [Arthrobacter sp. Br18]|uniref:sensor histidine kinase n=1 Tax=Arthrobacter sp. Br18 TaxID=1312954 RepID=UPI0004BC855C|nr:histidine kinase [Arthrobacter sp. Br18]
MDRQAVAVLAVIGAVLTVATVTAVIAMGVSWNDVVQSYTLTNLVVGCGFLASGVLIGRSKPRNAVAWILLAGGVGHLITAWLGPVILFGLEQHWPEPLTRTLTTIFLCAWQLGLGGLFPLALLLFPDGHYPSVRWRPLARVIVGLTVLQISLGALGTGTLFGDPSSSSILSTGLVVPTLVVLGIGMVTAGTLLLTIASLVVRYVKGTEAERLQLLWLILAVIAMLVINSQRWLTGDGPILLLLSFTLVPVAIAVAIVRYRLLDIRLVVSRTLLYAAVSALAIAVFAGLIAGSSFLLPEDADRGVAVAAALAVAIGFNPVRVFLQGVIDKVFYGARGDPVGTARQLGEQLESGDDLDGLLERARAVLRLPALSLRTENGTIAAAGTPLNEGTEVSIPLTYRRAATGTMLVGLRRGDSTLHPADRRILSLIGTPLSVALYSTDLVGQLQASRAAIVSAREEERLRLHRELHDRLGPVLTGAVFRTDAASNRLRTDLLEAERLLVEVRAGLREAFDGVRRIVYGLRPLELEELGLPGALRQRFASPQDRGKSSVTVHLDTPGFLPELPAAVEVAAFRIAVEAVTNALRHSAAELCVVTIRAAEMLTIEITDDGPPAIAPWRHGIGLRSVLERAEELGGTAVAGPPRPGDGYSRSFPFRRTANRTGRTRDQERCSECLRP